MNSFYHFKKAIELNDMNKAMLILRDKTESVARKIMIKAKIHVTEYKGKAFWHWAQNYIIKTCLKRDEWESCPHSHPNDAIKPVPQPPVRQHRFDRQAFEETYQAYLSCEYPADVCHPADVKQPSALNMNEEVHHSDYTTVAREKCVSERRHPSEVSSIAAPVHGEPCFTPEQPRHATAAGKQTSCTGWCCLTVFHDMVTYLVRQRPPGSLHDFTSVQTTRCLRYLFCPRKDLRRTTEYGLVLLLFVLGIYFSRTRENAMATNENDLRNAGFTSKDIARLHSALANQGGTLEELLTTLANRFRAATWITTVLSLVYIVTVVTGSRTHILTGGIAILIALVIVWCSIPVSLSRKARLFRKLNP